jgi:menaquinone-dependent protoporphyrinogen oxidase
MKKGANALKILILYATAHGSTKLCAEKLAAAIAGQADVFPFRHFSGDISQYDCVAVGSPVYGGSILKEAKEYCRANCNILAKKPFAVFFSCLSENEANVRSYLLRNFPPELAKSALACDSFGGAFYFTKLNFLERGIDRGLAKAYAKSAGITAPDGTTDFVTISDEKIAAFAKKIEKAVKIPG